MILKALRIIMLILSLYGYFSVISRKMKSELAIGFLFSFIGVALVLAGIMNILPEVSWAITLMGLLAFGRSVWKKEKFKDKISFGVVFFALMSFAFAILLFGEQFTEYDDFSHWALVVKSLINHDRFPTFLDQLILFSQYPLGSSAFVYHVVNISGIRAEWVQMLAQAILMLGMSVGIFAFSDNRESQVFTAASIVILLCSNNVFTSLYVDTLLAMCALYCFCLSVYCCRESAEENYIYIIPAILYLVSVKNSGLIFCMFTLAYLALHAARKKNITKKFVIISLLPFLLCWLWQKHVDQVIYNGLYTKHSMNPKQLLDGFSQKTAEDISSVVNAFVKETFSMSNGFWLIMLLLLFLYIAVHFFVSKKQELKTLIILTVAFYVIYQFGNLLMYLFSMPIGEAAELASYDRYHRTILIYVAGLNVVIVNMLISTEKVPWKGKKHYRLYGICSLAVVFILLCGGVKPNLAYYLRDDSVQSSRHRLERLIHEYNVLPEYSYLIVVEEDYVDTKFYAVLGRYLLDSHSTELCHACELIDIDVWDEFDYLIRVDETEAAAQYTEKVFGSREQVITLWDY